MEELKVLTSVENWLTNEVVKMYRHEVSLKQSLADWIRNSNNPKLKTLLQHYFDIMKQHVNVLESHIRKETAYKSAIKSNSVMDAMIKEINNNIQACTDYSLADVCLISGLQSINHYKISSYGTLATIAEMLGKTKMSLMMRELEGIEKTTDLQLTDMAIHGINQAAIIAIGR